MLQLACIMSIAMSITELVAQIFVLVFLNYRRADRQTQTDRETHTHISTNADKHINFNYFIS
jgi:cell division protein FtsX